ncbi:VIT1/CCC1 transporter family protein [Alicyclobacillus macrosporangiidus]|uniref:VIT1/CCC1 transporter family protein n=1 Tax=Alicyclobacillus macrosporangiidus TaxID=392015 RepID=UPI000B20802C|nr:VIT1/CCC1 transporter family protein [Alicyclobacillus macrosporangiidus]
MSMQYPATVASVSENLARLLGRERWHKTHTAGWIGDAIYGVNDGLGAIFGIIAGVAGYTASSSTVLISGLFGALASTLSMGAGAWLATKSETELRQSEIAHERREILEDPEHEIEELALMYQLKGFDEAESFQMARRIAQDTELFVKTMAQEELGFHDESAGSHWKSAVIGSLSTLVGGLVPLVPFFFMTGTVAMVAAAIVSIAAHFAVGAAKSLVTARSWWASGIEMTLAGVIVGVVAYGLGILGTMLVHV